MDTARPPPFIGGIDEDSNGDVEKDTTHVLGSHSEDKMCSSSNHNHK